MKLFIRKIIDKLWWKLNLSQKLRWLNDKSYLKLKYFTKTGKVLNLDSPRTFNEKMQWLKLNDFTPFYVTLADKLAVKDYIASMFDPELIAETYETWHSVDDIDISTLPDKFVLKTNHDSGGVVLCGNRDTFSLINAKRKLSISLEKNYYWSGREKPYKYISPCIFAEEYIETDSISSLVDYKLLHFGNGRIITLVIEDRGEPSGMKKTYFDEDWTPLNLIESGHKHNPNFEKPVNFNRMKEIANVIASTLPFARIDFYEVRGRLYFGEVTFYPNSGYEAFSPESYDYEFGEWIPIGGSIEE